MAVNDILQIVFRARSGDQDGLNVRHWLVATEATGGATHLEIATAFFGLASVLYTPLLSDQAAFFSVSVQRVFPTPPTMPVLSPQTPVLGAGTGDLLPRQVSGLISLRTALAGRAFRGRVYIPFPSESMNNLDSTPEAAYVSNLALLGAIFMDPQTVAGATGTSGLASVIFHRATNTFTLVTGGMANDAWATQRRRGSYGRPNPQGGAGGIPIG